MAPPADADDEVAYEARVLIGADEVCYCAFHGGRGQAIDDDDVTLIDRPGMQLDVLPRSSLAVRYGESERRFVELGVSV